MGKDPFEDPELQSLRDSMRPAAGQTRWGKVATGVLVVACATFAIGYHLPLQRAHGSLAAEFAQQKSNIDSASRAADDARKRVKELSDKNEALQAQLDSLQQRDKAGADASQGIKTALEAKLQKQIAGAQAVVGSAGGRAVTQLAHGFLVTKGKLELSAPGKAALCGVASASGNRALRVVAIAGKKDIPPLLVAKLKTPLAYNLALAELVSKALLDQCKVAPGKLTATGVPAEPGFGPQLEGKKLTGARVELWLEG